MEKESVVHTQNGLLLHFKKEISSHTLRWMNPEDRLNKINHAQKDRDCTIPWIWGHLK